MLEFSNLNVWAIVVAILIDLVVGAAWYSPLGFARQWSKRSAVNMLELPKDVANQAIGLVTLSGIVQMVALAALVRSLAANTFTEGLLIGLFVALCFVAATTVGDTAYARRGLQYWLINAGFFVVVFPITAGLLAVW